MNLIPYCLCLISTNNCWSQELQLLLVLIISNAYSFHMYTCRFLSSYVLDITIPLRWFLLFWSRIGVWLIQMYPFLFCLFVLYQLKNSYILVIVFVHIHTCIAFFVFRPVKEWTYSVYSKSYMCNLSIHLFACLIPVKEQM